MTAPIGVVAESDLYERQVQSRDLQCTTRYTVVDLVDDSRNRL